MARKPTGNPLADRCGHKVEGAHFTCFASTGGCRVAEWDERDPGLPIKFGPCSNGEYDPVPLTPVVEETIRRARDEQLL